MVVAHCEEEILRFSATIDLKPMDTIACHLRELLSLAMDSFGQVERLKIANNIVPIHEIV